MFCRERVARFTAIQGEVESLGARLRAIGNGTAPMAQDFVEQFSVSFPVYTDPGRQTYQLAGFRRELGFRLKTLGRAKRALSAGHKQGRTRGDALQQGGVLVVDRDGELAFAHVDDGPGDEADLEHLVDVVRSLSR